MDNDRPVFGTLHVFNSATGSPIIDIQGYLKIKEIDKYFLRVEQSDARISDRKKVHIIHMSSSMAYYFIDESDDVRLEKVSVSTHVQ